MSVTSNTGTVVKVENADGYEGEDSMFEHPSRVRVLTEKGTDLYVATKDDWYAKLQKLWDTFQSMCNTMDSSVADAVALRKLEKELRKQVLAYDSTLADFAAFLARTNTEQSAADLKKLQSSSTDRSNTIDAAFTRIDDKMQTLLEAASNRSRASRKSKSHHSGASTSVSSLRAKGLIKVESARASMKFAEKQAEILKQQAAIEEQLKHEAAKVDRKKKELNASLKLLKIQEKVEVAEAEMQALNIAIEEADSEHSPDISVPKEDPKQRVQRYVNEQSQLTGHNNYESTPRFSLPPPQFTLGNTTIQKSVPTLSRESEMSPHIHFTSDLNAAAPEFQPNTTTDRGVAAELSSFLLKKELLLSRLMMFDDKPESFSIWKNSFISVVKGLQMTPSEELDLLVRWLGPESSKHVTRLRAAYANDPNMGLAQVWQRLDERYGCPELVEAALRNKLSAFPKLTNKDNSKLYDLADIAAEIVAVMQDPRYSSLLAYYNSSSGVNSLVNKLPYNLQERWTGVAVRYKTEHGVIFPPFTVFADYLVEVSKVKNDPSFAYDISQNTSKKDNKDGYVSRSSKSSNVVSARITQVQNTTKETEIPQQTNNPTKIENQTKLQLSTHCPIHKSKHSLTQCRTFQSKSLSDRKDLLKKLSICFKCCAATDHQAKSCTQTVHCSECGSNRHVTALHVSTPKPNAQTFVSDSRNASNEEHSTSVIPKCTQICANGFAGKSCSKTVLAKIYPQGKPDQALNVYVILDDQSNASLAKPQLLDMLGVNGPKQSYTMSSCSGVTEAFGRYAKGYVVEALDGSRCFHLPTLIECDEIPNYRNEIPTPEVAKSYPHLADLQKYIPPLNPDAEILLLLGRDLIEVHHVLDQRIGPQNSPYAQRLPLGWVIVGETCLNKFHKQQVINVNKVYVLPGGRPSLFEPCPNNFNIKTDMNHPPMTDLDAKGKFGQAVFAKSEDDEKKGMSIHDRQFLHIMQTELHKDEEGNWIAPLPFLDKRQKLPNNREFAFRRAKTLDRSLNKDDTKRQHMFAFMQNILDKGHAELAPELVGDEECWYLPIFGVYHPRKPNQIRAVFDSSAKFNGLALNDVLLKGPDLSNSLLGVLLRFREEKFAVTADIQQMFYCFLVKPEHRNFLRFFWYRNNDPNQELVEYRMRVHVFGNSPSPAIATYGLRETASNAQETFGHDMEDFVHRNFYVDDGLGSFPTEAEAVDLLKRTQKALQSNGNLRLHKIASNSVEILKSFPAEDLAKGLENLSFEDDALPTQRSLGMVWELPSDTFTFKCSQEDRPFTKRGVLSTINSTFDPVGFVAPVTIRGKEILRQLTSNSADWDESLPMDQQVVWEEWKDSLSELEGIHVPRMYTSTSFKKAAEQELHIFSDASEKAIAAVAYLKLIDHQGKPNVGFVLGKAKLAPSHGHTIPRLELCAAVVAVEIAEFVSEHLDIPMSKTTFYTDSKIVLGYIHNESRRFHVYVANRVARIRKSANPCQWQYVPTDKNPADVGTRSSSAADLPYSLWLTGPSFLLKVDDSEKEMENYPLKDPDQDQELRPQVSSLITNMERKTFLGTERFTRFSSWIKLVETVARLQHIAQCFTEKDAEMCQDKAADPNKCLGWHYCQESKSVDSFIGASKFIIKEMQREHFAEELQCLGTGNPLKKQSTLTNFDPKLDEDGLLRIGGRIKNANETYQFKSPLIIPGKHHVALLLVRHYHEQIAHQGRHLTEGAIREAGYWIIGGRGLISSVIHKCVKCKELRGKCEQQKMADLPADRLTPSPPFTYVGVDVFGPWSVVARRTRGGQANSKRWAVLFTCLAIRAIHIEVIEEMTSSAFINALRRFVSIRGKVKEFRSDRGSNFIGSVDDLQIDAINVEDGPLKKFLYEKGTVWIFNPPHASHMGGVWERMIGVTRRILDSLLGNVSAKSLTHETLCTLMAEVSAIVNARPIVPVSTDPESPGVLSPNALLTHKTNQDFFPSGSVELKDMYRSQWKHVQALADMFWKQWRLEYLHSLQQRRKWQDNRPNIAIGDYVLLKDKQVIRNEWPRGVVTEVFPGKDGIVRKCVVKVVKGNSTSTYTRPVTELVILLSAKP